MSDTTTTAPATTPAGTYIWQDLFTPDPKAAEIFYGELFGWTVTPMPMPDVAWTYDVLENAGQGFGGCMPLVPGQGDVARWVPYLTVPDDDVDAAAQRAAAAGGMVVQAPMDIPAVGRFATVVDPDGTATNPFHPIPPEAGMPPEREGSAPIGGISWNELWVNDLDKARDLYASVYGWSIDDAGMGGDMQYFVCNSEGGPMRGGFGATQGRMSPVAVFYVHVADLDASAAKVAELGGTTEGPIMEVREIGRMQWARDPQGAQFCLHEEPK